VLKFLDFIYIFQVQLFFKFKFYSFLTKIQCMYNVEVKNTTNFFPHLLKVLQNYYLKNEIFIFKRNMYPRSNLIDSRKKLTLSYDYFRTGKKSDYINWKSRFNQFENGRIRIFVEIIR